MKKRYTNPTFKEYHPDQMLLFSPNLNDLIPQNHVVRVVRQVIDQINIESIIKKYKGGGSSSYQNPTDTLTLPHHLKQYTNLYRVC
jgi:transposase